MDEDDTLIADLQRQAVDAVNKTIEEAVEAALQGGTCGVKVTRYRYAWGVTAEVDPAVPYGEIHEFLLD